MTSLVTPAKIKELRDRTGVGMGKCKEALELSNGDIEEAINFLRKAGIASAVKKEGREAKEGMILSHANNGVIAIVEGNAETDFVVKNERFQTFIENVVREVAATRPTTLEAFLQQPYTPDPGLTVDQYRAQLVHVIGENIQIRRMQLLEKKPNSSIGLYSHLGGKIMTAVIIEGSDDEEALAKEIAMHAAAAAPEYISPEEVPQQTIAQEREIAAEQIKGKPDNVKEKIIEGKLNAYYDGICLLRQKYIKDDSVSIQELVDKRAKESGKPLKVKSFLRWVVGA